MRTVPSNPILLVTLLAAAACGSDKTGSPPGASGGNVTGGAAGGTSGGASGGVGAGGRAPSGGLSSGGTAGSGGGVPAAGTAGKVATGGATGSGGQGGSSGGGKTSSGGNAGTSAGGGGNAGTSAGGGNAGRSGGGSSGAGAAGGGAGGTGAMAGQGGGAGSGEKILAATPPMGWNSWNTFQCNISESLIKAVADTMVSSGMKAAGYEYVNLDDCWMNGRDSSGKLRWNTTKFPAGIPALAEYVHSKGLKFGIYQSANTATCLGLYGGVDKAIAVGSLGHEAQDAATFAEWGVDFLKYDLCAGQRSSIIKMGTAIRAQTRPILYSINPGNGQNDLDPPKPNWDMQGVAHIWRIGFDINTTWDAVIRLVDENTKLHSYAGPGHFNDPDMLEVGKLANVNEDRAHFALWAIMAAPLIAGNDIRSMSASTRDILTNTEIIAVNQDPLGLQGQLVASPGNNLQVWSKKLSTPNTVAVVLFNRGSSAASITAQWSALGLSGSATVRDLWTHMDLGSFTESYTAMNVPGHGAAMLRITATP